MSLLFSSIVKGCFAWVLILVFAPSLARAQLFTLSSITGWWDYDSAYIRQVDPTTGATISIQWISLPAGTYGAYTTGMAAHPTTGEFFALVESAPSPTGPICRHKLVKIDPATGAATILGNTGACFASLAFHSNGTLYGVTNSEGAEPPSLFTLDTTSATPTLLISFDTVGRSSGAVVGGSGLAFNPSDGLLYRSGRVDVSDQIFQAINPNTLAVTDIPLSGSPTDEIIALTHSFENTLLGADVGNRLFSITTEGVRTLIGPTDHLPRGLAFATTLGAPPLAIGATTLATGEAGVSFTSDLLISGGVAPYIVSINGKLPAGLSLGNDGIISGTPSPTAKSEKFTVRITDSLNGSVSKTFKMTILKALSVSERTKTGRVGKNYHASVKTKGGLGPFNWSITFGALPPGLSFNAVTGAITGTPTQEGEFPFTVQVTDALGGVAVENLTLKIR
jgi:hypothetical protein